MTTGLEVFTVTVTISEAKSSETSDGMVQVTVGTPPTSPSVTAVATPSTVDGAVPAGEP